MLFKNHLLKTISNPTALIDTKKKQNDASIFCKSGKANFFFDKMYSKIEFHP